MAVLFNLFSSSNILQRWTAKQQTLKFSQKDDAAGNNGLVSAMCLQTPVTKKQ